MVLASKYSCITFSLRFYALASLYLCTISDESLAKLQSDGFGDIKLGKFIQNIRQDYALSEQSLAKYAKSPNSPNFSHVKLSSFMVVGD